MPDDNSQPQGPQLSSQPVFSPVSSTSPALIPSPQPKPPKKSKKALAIVTGVVVVMLAAAGMVTYLLLSENSKTTSDTTPKTTAEILMQLGTSLKTKLKNSANASTLVSKSNDPASVIYRFDNKNWIVADKDAAMLTFASVLTAESENKSDYNSAINYLKSQNFTEAKLTAAAYSSTATMTRYFISKDTVCNLSNTSPTILYDDSTTSPQYLLQIDCSKIADFQDNIKAVKPFADVYSGSDSSKNTADPLFGGTPTIQNSINKGYKNAKLAISSVSEVNSSSTGEFYQTPDKKWHFFTSTKDQDKIACSDYNTDDLKKAYIGFTCWDESANASAFVKQDDPTFEVVPGSIGG